MGRELINTRVELDRETDTDLRKIAKAEMRTSKRGMAAVLLTRVTRAWRDNPDSLRALKLVQD